MTNILSVDFDWIMEPSITIYDPFVNDKTPIETALNLSSNVILPADFSKYEMLMTVLGNLTQKMNIQERIQFRTSHNEIIDCIENVWELNQSKYNIYNIDHHHDCGYHVDTMEEIDRIGLLDNNWVQFCRHLNSYTWINNKNSGTYIPDQLRDAIPNYQQTYDINLIGYIKFDYIFVCLSPQWVPPMYHPLFDALEFSVGNLFQKERNVLKQYKIIDDDTDELKLEITNENDVH